MSGARRGGRPAPGPPLAFPRGGDTRREQAYRNLVRTARPLPGYAEWEVGAGFADAAAAVRASRR